LLPRDLADSSRHTKPVPIGRRNVGDPELDQDGERGRLSDEGALVFGRDLEFLLVAAQDVPEAPRDGGAAGAIARRSSCDCALSASLRLPAVQNGS